MIGRVFVGVYCDWEFALAFILAQRESWILSTADCWTNRCYKPLIPTCMDLLNHVHGSPEPHQLLLVLIAFRTHQEWQIVRYLSERQYKHGRSWYQTGRRWFLLLWNTDFSKPVCFMDLGRFQRLLDQSGVVGQQHNSRNRHPVRVIWSLPIVDKIQDWQDSGTLP